MTSDREALYELWSRHGSNIESDSSEGYELADAIIAAGFVRAPEWEYGVSWLEGDERVFRAVEDDWRASVEVQRINRGYPYPEENYVARRRSAGDWERVEGV